MLGLGLALGLGLRLGLLLELGVRVRVGVGVRVREPRGPTSSTEQRPGGAPWLPAGYTRRAKRPLPAISNGAVTELPGARKTMEDHRRPG